MQVTVKSGKYVVAVSGGVDSMVLLDVLTKLPGVDLVVAHFEHGIREDSDEDRKLVEKAAAAYDVPFIYERGNLGAGVSESWAREVRYTFLNKVLEETGSQAIITAHHQDDMLETAIINMTRGTGRKGLSSMAGGDVVRPLLSYSKQEILDYARANNITWHEDSTNGNDAYLRNYIRHQVLPRLDDASKQQLLSYIGKAQELNPAIDGLLSDDLRANMNDDGLNRQWFIMLPYNVSCETMAAWLRSQGVREFDRKLIERLVVAAKVAQPGKRIDVNAVTLLKIGKGRLQLSARNSF